MTSQITPYFSCFGVFKSLLPLVPRLNFIFLKIDLEPDVGAIIIE